jgi:hypothetical protein
MWILIKYDRRSDSESVESLLSTDSAVDNYRNLMLNTHADARIVFNGTLVKRHKHMHPLLVHGNYDYYILWMEPI